jgi:uncharacterized protein (TIRG00374 family)
MRFHLRTVLVVALAVGLLAWFLRNADLHRVWAEIRYGRLDLLLLAVVTVMVSYTLRAFRWQYMLSAVGPTHFGTAFRTTVIGFAASFLLPARPGEFLRPYLLAREEGLSAAACFATVLLERLFDTITVLVLFASFLLFFVPAMDGERAALFATIKLGGLAAAAAALLGLVVVYFLAGHPVALARLSSGVQRVLPARTAPAVSRLIHTFAEGLGVMRQPRHLLMTAGLSFPLWLSIAAGIWITSRAFHVQMGYAGSFLVMTILVVGVAVPTPGAVGGFHAFYQLAVVSFFGVPNDRAVGAAIVLHAVSFVPVTILGIVFMAQEGLSLGGVRRLAGEAEVAEEGRP